MDDVDKALDEAGLTNPHVREYVNHWAELTGAERVEVVSAADDARLLQESVDAGEIGVLVDVFADRGVVQPGRIQGRLDICHQKELPLVRCPGPHCSAPTAQRARHHNHHAPVGTLKSERFTNAGLISGWPRGSAILIRSRCPQR